MVVSEAETGPEGTEKAGRALWGPRGQVLTMSCCCSRPPPAGTPRISMSPGLLGRHSEAEPPLLHLWSRITALLTGGRGLQLAHQGSPPPALCSS